MLRIGRMVINASKIVKVVRDDKAKVTTVFFDNGSTAKFKKHGEVVWTYFKSNVLKTIAAPAVASRYRSY